VNWLNGNAHDCYVAVAGLNPAPIIQPFGKFSQFLAGLLAAMALTVKLSSGWMAIFSLKFGVVIWLICVSSSD
jgi:hypothetical protein